MGTKALMSVEEFDRLVEPDELSYELDEGELVVITKPRRKTYMSSAPTPSARRMSRLLPRSARTGSIPMPTSPALPTSP
jgi:hypothetical protein